MLPLASRTVLRPTGALAFRINSWIGTGMRRQWRALLVSHWRIS